uniref:Myb/SANT DNA binding domain containing 5 family member 9 n=1 Tax=Mus musculus TaxID=10090 RepID=A2BEJ2_MOUSE
MQREDNRVQSVRNDKEVNRRRRLRQEGQSSSGPWTEDEIWILLQEWAMVEYELGDPGNKMHAKAKSLSRRLSNRGLRKSKNSCLDVMVKMKDLHTRLCNERPRAYRLYSTYEWILYEILGHPRSQGGYVPGALYNWSGYHRPSSSPQTPMVMPSPVYQPWDYGMSASSGQLHGNPSLIMSSQDSLVPRWDAWNATYPLPVQHVLLASLSGDNNFQLAWSPRDESSSPQ